MLTLSFSPLLPAWALWALAAAVAALVLIAARAPSVCEVERSMTTATTSFTFSRSSWISDGFASAATTSASAANATRCAGAMVSAGAR